MNRSKSLLQFLYELNKVTAGLLFFAVLIVIYIPYKIFLSSPSPNSISYRDNNFYVLNLNIPGNLNFCGEKIPSNDYDIKEALDKEFFGNAYWKSNSVILFNKTQKWFPYIEPILKQEGVPDDFKYLAFIESHLSNASSPAGAAGFWQLVPASARNYGLVVNEDVDERYNVEKATRAACRHVKDAYAVFKNWTLAAAAYNLGIGGVQGALQRQNTDNYYDLMLNPETGSFVYRILAYKTLFSNPAHFGIKSKKRGYFSKITFKIFKVDSSITNLEAFAKYIGTNKQTIKGFNPWLMKDGLNNPENKLYEIKIPKKPEGDYSSYLADLSSGQPISEAASDNTVNTESAGSTSTQTSKIDSTQLLKKTVYYISKSEESYKAIADQYHVKPEEIKKWNNVGDAEFTTKGQVLIIHYFIAK